MYRKLSMKAESASASVARKEKKLQDESQVRRSMMLQLSGTNARERRLTILDSYEARSPRGEALNYNLSLSEVERSRLLYQPMVGSIRPYYDRMELPEDIVSSFSNAQDVLLFLMVQEG